MSVRRPWRTPASEADGFRVDAGQQVVGEDDLFFGAGLGRLARGFLVEHGGGERRCVAGRARRLDSGASHCSPGAVDSVAVGADRTPFLTRVSGVARGFGRSAE